MPCARFCLDSVRDEGASNWSFSVLLTFVCVCCAPVFDTSRQNGNILMAFVLGGIKAS